MISQYEVELLKQHFHIQSEKLIYLPYLFDKQQPMHPSPDFEKRQHFMMIGNFLHQPNWDANLFCVQKIWPSIRKQLPDAQLHIYGAYATDKHQQCHQPKQGVYLKGRAEDALATLSQYRVNLAPLRFGAGQKGKLFESFLTGTPCITTPIGIEAMDLGIDCGYDLSDDAIKIAENATQCHQQVDLWSHIQQQGYLMLNQNFEQTEHAGSFYKQVVEHYANLEQHRHQDFLQTLLWQQQFRSTEFMSRWISEKNRSNSN